MRRLFRARARHAAQDADAGISMVELVVAMAVTLVLGAMVSMFFIQAVQQTRKVDGRNEISSQGRIAMDSWSKLLRTVEDPDLGGTLPQIQQMEGDRIVFYASLDNRTAVPDAAGAIDYATDALPIKVELWLDTSTNQLHERRWTGARDAAGVASWAGTPSERVVARNVGLVAAGAGTRPLFTPLRSTDVDTDADGYSDSTVTGAGMNLTSAALSTVDGVEVAFTATAGTGRTGTVQTFVSRIAFVNEI